MGYNSIWTSIKTILLNLVWSWKPLQAVYNYDVKTSEVFPYAIISTKDWVEDIIDTANNISTKNFTIRVINVNKNVEVMEDMMRTLCDSIIAELRKEANETLWGTVYKFIPFTIQWWWAEWELPTRMFEIWIEVTEMYSI